MRRPPRCSPLTWFRQNAELSRPWVANAECGRHQHLPWIEDGRPSPEHLAEMQAICETCPVRLQCADYAVRTNGNKGADGGFYAGHWIPWSYSNDNVTRSGLASSRRRLKELAAQL